MTKQNPRHIGILGLALILAPFATAQGMSAAHSSVQTAMTAAQSAAAMSAQHSAAASQAANASAQAAAMHGAQVSAANSPAVTGSTSTAVAATTAAGAPIPQTKGTLNSGLATSASATPGRSADKGDDANADLNNNGTTRAPGLADNDKVSGQISTSLNSTQISMEIHGATVANRESVLTQVDRNIAATHRSLAQLRHSARGIHADARTQVNAAFEQVRVAEHALRESLAAARQATADTFAAAQAKLESDYQAYVAAVAAAEATVKGSVSTSASVTR